MLKSLTVVILAIFIIGPMSHSIYAQAERSKAYGLLIDNTRSLEKQFDQVKLLSKSVVDQVHTRGQVQLFSFTWTQDASYRVEPDHVDRVYAIGITGDLDTGVSDAE